MLRYKLMNVHHANFASVETSSDAVVDDFTMDAPVQSTVYLTVNCK